MADVITVHHLDQSRSYRLLWLLEELGLDYEIREYKRDPGTHRAPASLREVHPLGKAPVVTIGELTLAESGAIFEYLSDRYGEGRLRPSDPDGLLRYRYWLHYAEGSLAPPVLVKLLVDNIRKAPVPFFIKPVTRQIADKLVDGYVGAEMERHGAFLEQALSENPWLCGDEITAADILMSFPVEGFVSRHDQPDSLPNCKAFIERCRARPAFARAEERGGALRIVG